MKELPEICATCKYYAILENYRLCTLKKKIIKIKEKNKQKKEVLVRIKELETMLKRSGEENKNSILLRLCETELEILNKEWWQAVDDRMKIRQQLKELGSIL